MRWLLEESIPLGLSKGGILHVFAPLLAFTKLFDALFNPLALSPVGIEILFMEWVQVVQIGQVVWP